MSAPGSEMDGLGLGDWESELPASPRAEQTPFL